MKKNVDEKKSVDLQMFFFIHTSLSKEVLQEWRVHSHWFSVNQKLVEISKNNFNTI